MPFPNLLQSESPIELPVNAAETLRGGFQDHSSPLTGVFLPGFASHLGGNKSLLLAQHARQQKRSWLRFDYRGMGGSDGDFGELSVTRYLEDVHTVLRYLAPRPILLVGSSLGGWVATLAARCWPEQVRAALLIAPAYNFIQDYFAALPAPEQDAWQKQGQRQWSLGPQGPSYAMRFALVTDAVKHDVLRDPPQLQQPLHILHGSADTAVPVQRSFDFARRAHANPLSLQVLPGIDHRLQGADSALLRALDRLWETVTPSSGA